MKDCEQYAALLDAFADGDLFTEDMMYVQQHLNTCPHCQAYLEDLLAIRAAFPTVEDTVVPDGFADSIMAAVAAQPRTAAAAPRKKRSPAWTKTLMPLAACLALVVLLQNGPLSSGGTNEAASIAYSSAPESAMESESAEESFASGSTGGASSVSSASASARIENDPLAPAESMDIISDSTVKHTSKTTAAGSPAEAEPPVSYAVTVYLPEQALPFMSAEALLTETENEAHYVLSAEDYRELLIQLEPHQITPEGPELPGHEDPVDPILVIVKK